MNDESFDKILNDKLNVEKDFLFTEGDWQTMERQIDVAKAARRRRWLWLGASLLLLPLFGLLGWNSWALHNAQSTIDGLAQEVKTLRQEKQTLVLPPSVNEQQTTTKSDTVYHHIIVKRYDTIFQTVVRRDLSDAAPSFRQDVSASFQKGKTETTVTQTITENIVKPKITISKQPKQEEKVLEKPTVATEKTDITSKNEETKPLDKPISTEKEAKTERENNSEKNTVNQPIVDLNKAIVEQKIDTTIAKQPLPDTFGIFSQKNIEAQKVPESPQLTEKTLEKQAKKEKTRRLPIIKPIKIAGYDIGVSSGLAIIDGKDILRKDGFSIGGRGGILLGERWKILGEVEYVALSYEVSKITGLDIPTIAPPTVNDELKEVHVGQPYWHYSLGLQYALTRTRLKPYIGISALGQSKLEEKFEYQFENKLTKEDVFVKTMRNDNSFQMPFLRLQAGAEYPIFGKIKAQVETSYDVNIGNVPQFKPLWQVKGAILYRF